MKEFIHKELEYTGLLQYFTEIFSSTTDTKTVKKNPAFYKMIAKSLGRPPSSIIHIGDNINNDYYSPIKAGLHAYLLQRYSSSKKSYIVISLKEFASVVEKKYNVI
jgi:FMN phosphatase YigB (HAD superfamily)